MKMEITTVTYLICKNRSVGEILAQKLVTTNEMAKALMHKQEIDCNDLE